MTLNSKNEKNDWGKVPRFACYYGPGIPLDIRKKDSIGSFKYSVKRYF